ncbi:MAG TPA: T9SS type A sorting domain-containing protein, partial [Chitinophagales bacterium]|nr:T9SS type A sorting domain-containing protein [Chitinophagales bacterium]
MNVNNLPKLKQLYCENNKITSLNANNLVSLESLTCHNNLLSILTVNGDNNLPTLNCENNLIQSLDVSNLTKLKNLKCINNKITTLKISGNSVLESVNCSNNLIANLDASNMSNLITLSCNYNQITNINTTGCNKLFDLYCDNNLLTNISLNHLPKLQYFLCSNNNLTNIDVNAVTTLKTLTLNNNQLTNLNVTNLVNLINLSCNQNRLTTLDINNLLNLVFLSFGNNMISRMTLPGLANLQTLNCSNNNLDSIKLTYLTQLVTLVCNNNRFRNLNLRNLKLLQYLYCNNNELTDLDATSLINLKEINCTYNQLTKLNISNINDLQKLQANNNKLISIYMKNGLNSASAIGYYIFNNNPTLRFICADTSDLNAIKSKLIFYNYKTTTANTFCNACADGTHYTLAGGLKLDLDNNGCTPLDITLPNFKLKLKSATDSGYAIADANGNFSLVIDTGTFTITPQIFFNNDYFVSSPVSTTITFPKDSIPTHFCILPRDIHHNVNVSTFSIRAPRPGFSDARYKLIVKNIGNMLESGTMKFIYDENRQNFVSASRTPNKIASGELTFNFTNLYPFQTSEVMLTMRTNSPSENPAVNRGDILTFSAQAELTNGVIDEFPQNNIIIIKVPVVGSCDPNDKVCVEGEVVTPAIIGNYVNYVIRFENIGTENAESVVITDFIDLAKFDINTLEINSASHLCNTTISNGNKVQFIFDNINLGTTDPEKYGYVSFKIKTKSNLVVGDSLKNTADIFFDYNLPVKTNTAGTLIDNIILGVKNTSNKNGVLDVYPNPSTGNFTINFEAKGTYPLNVKIIDLKGSTVFEKNVNHSEKSNIVVDANDLSNGVYMINITAGKDNWVQKLMIV